MKKLTLLYPIIAGSLFIIIAGIGIDIGFGTSMNEINLRLIIATPFILLLIIFSLIWLKTQSTEEYIQYLEQRRLTKEKKWGVDGDREYELFLNGKAPWLMKRSKKNIDWKNIKWIRIILAVTMMLAILIIWSPFYNFSFSKEVNLIFFILIMLWIGFEQICAIRFKRKNISKKGESYE